MAALTAQTGRICRLNVAPVLGVYINRSSSTKVVRDQSSNLTAYRRGRGGRSSFSGVVATVFGASGFLGTRVVNKLGKVGSQVVCPYRGDPYDMKELRLAGDLGQILFMPYDLRDEDSLYKSMKYSTVVVNLVGRDWETKNFTFDQVHHEGAARIARIAREVGVERLIHVSHINAQPSPPPIYLSEGSGFLRSKYAGEEAVKAAFPGATILRPSDMYGEGDRFLSYYACIYRRARGTMPLWKKGTQTVKSPIWVSDVAQGIVNAAMNPDTAGKTYDCVGPHKYQLSELVDYMYRVMRWTDLKRSYLTPLFKLKVKLFSIAPSTPFLTMDKLDREHVSDVARSILTLEDLDVTPTKLESRIKYELEPFKRLRYYEDAIGEFADATPPPVIS